MSAIIAAAATAAILVAHPAAAVDCSKAVTTVDMRECAQADYDKADKRLNEAYKRVMAHPGLDEESRKILRDAQRKWIPFRDAECAWAADAMRGGTGASLLGLSCLSKMTEERAEALEQALTAR